MKPRNFSPQQMFQEMAAAHQPQCKFDGDDAEYFQQWKSETLPRVLATLGKTPPSCAPNPHFVAQWEHDNVRKQRWIIDVNPWLSATFDINYPLQMEEGENRPAIMVCVGHDRQNGHKSLMGNAMESGEPDTPAPSNAFGHQLAKAGFVTFAIDPLGMGDLSDIGKPNFRSQSEGRDWCNVYYLHATIMGMTSLAINLAHARAAMDFAATLPGVDGDAFGVMGSSGGGTMSLWVSLFEERIKATEIICYSDLFAFFGARDTNYCGWQITPGLFDLVDLPELQGLLAPRPLLIDIGARDECFRLESAMECFRGVESIYRAAGAEENLELDLHSGGHAWGGHKSKAFFEKNLRGS